MKLDFITRCKTYIIAIVLSSIFLSIDAPEAYKERFTSLNPDIGCIFYGAILPSLIWPVTIPSVLYLKWAGYNKYYSIISVKP